MWLEAREPGSKELWKRYYDGSVVVGGPETKARAAAARETSAWVSVGVSERDATSGTLYTTNLVFAPDGRLDAWHHKLKPTGAERLVWGDAQDHYFPVSQTPWGPMGTLICWENYMPLARAALYQKDVSIYLAPNTNCNPEWQATVQHIAIEGRCYVVNCAPYIPDGPPLNGRGQSPARGRLPRRQLRGRPRRPLRSRRGAPVGYRRHPVRHARHAAGSRKQVGVRPHRPLRPARRRAPRGKRHLVRGREEPRTLFPLIRNAQEVARRNLPRTGPFGLTDIHHVPVRILPVQAEGTNMILASQLMRPPM